MNSDPLAITLTDELKQISQESVANLRQCIGMANAGTRKVLALSREQLEVWLNGMSGDALENIFTRHAVEGAAYNVAAASAGIDDRVDVRRFQEKAAELRGWLVTKDESGWHVDVVPPAAPAEPVPDADAPHESEPEA